MVIKRQCSFCANEIEPGTGTMFVKRDGSIYHFCSSSCRKQQLHLGRVGHRRKWTRAHAMKKVAAHAAGKGGGAPIASVPSPPPAPSPPEATPPEATSAPEAASPEGEGPEAPAKEPPTGSEEPPAAKPSGKPRRRTPKAAKPSGSESPPEPPSSP